MKKYFLTTLLLTLIQSTASASDFRHCIFKGVNLGGLENSYSYEKPFKFILAISASSSLGGYTSCKEYVGEEMTVTLEPKSKRPPEGEVIFVTYNYMDGGTSINEQGIESWKYLEFHEQN